MAQSVQLGCPWKQHAVMSVPGRLLVPGHQFIGREGGKERMEWGGEGDEWVKERMWRGGLRPGREQS